MIERLEPRIAPAVFSYIDVDGDSATVKTSKGTNAQLLNVISPYLSLEGIGFELRRIDLSSDPAFAGTDLTLTAKRTNFGGDGRVNVGYIDATSPDGGFDLDLGNIRISGDLGRIVAGDTTTNTLGVKTLTVGSIGRQGGSDLNSTIRGALGRLSVAGDFIGASLIVTGGSTATDGRINNLAIGGSLIGGSDGFTGFISASGNIGSATIGGDIQGAHGTGSGQIFVGGKLVSLNVEGSILGGDGNNSGRIQATSIGSIVITGSVAGSLALSDTHTGQAVINSSGDIGSVKISGSLIGVMEKSGRIEAGGSVQSIAIGGNLRHDQLPSSTQAGVIAITGNLGRLTIGGSIIGLGDGSAAILIQGVLNSAVIRGDIIAGEGFNNAKIAATRLDSVTVGGSLVGSGNNFGCGEIQAGVVGKVSIGGDVIGGGGFSGFIRGDNGIASVSIGGSVIGGADSSSGSIVSSNGTIGSVSIGGDLRGGDSRFATAALTDTGTIQGDRIGKITIGGSIIAGEEFSTGGLIRSGSIHANEDIGSVIVRGSLVGNATNPVLITAFGQANPTATTDIALKSLTVNGRVEFTTIQLGYDKSQQGQNADAQSGPITVGRDWIASYVIAGVNPTDNFVGDANDVKLTVSDGPQISSIASITIKGGVYGTPSNPTDRFGFAAEHIGAFKVGSVVIPLHAGARNDTFAANAAQPLSAGRSTGTPDGFEVHVVEV